MYLIWKAIRFRRDHADLFRDGEFVPLQSAGAYSRNVTAFVRRRGDSWAVAAIPRWLSQVPVKAKGQFNWEDTKITLPSDSPAKWKDILMSTQVRSKSEAGQPRLMVGDLFQKIPVAFFNAEKN